jgi:hypothetical protein
MSVSGPVLCYDVAVHRSLRHVWALVCSIAVSLCVSCSAPPLTELVVVVELGDGLEVPRDMTYATIRIERISGQLVRESVPFTGPDARGFPLTLGLRQAEDQPDGLDIFVEGYLADMLAISRRVQTRFVPGDRRVVHIVLERACYVRTCDPGLTCRAGSCVDPELDPSTLPRYTGTLPDAGTLDAGMDAASPDAGMDAPLPLDVGNDAAPDAPSDAARDAALDATTCEGDAGRSGMPEGCVLTRPPARVTCGGDGGDDGLVRTFALLDPVIDQSGGLWASSSFDLDGFCTNPLSPDSPQECVAPLGDPVQADGPGGVDNVVGQSVYISLLTFLPDFQRDTNESARRGRSVPILRIAGWNGEADDPRVSLSISAAIDVLPEGTSLPPTGLEVDNMLPSPRWDGTDTAYVAANYFAAADERFPLIADDNAYVTGYTLVARLPDRAPIDFPVPRGVGRIRLTAPIAVLDLAPDGRTVSNARLTGRWSFVDMLSHLGDIGVCTGSPDADMYLTAFNLLTQRVMDVRSVPGTGGAGVPCDAVSATLPFGAATAVRWGGIQSIELNPAACP